VERGHEVELARRYEELQRKLKPRQP
jgi:hypothetical protein